MPNKLAIYASLFISVLLVLTGCSQQGPKVSVEKSLVIATLVPEYEETIKNVYSKGYDNDIKTKSVFPNSNDVPSHWDDIDVVIDEYLKKNKDVDLVYGFTPDYLNGLVEKGSIKDLSALLDEALIEKIATAILEPIKLAGEGAVYAVAPSFHDYVLVYNKDIFKEVGVDKPRNSMNWEEVSTLAKEIQVKSNFKGITLGFPTSDHEFYYLYQNLSEPIGNFKNKKGKAILNNELNRKYWKIFTNLYKDNLKVTGEEFVKGEVAMAVLPLSKLVDTKFLEFYGDFDKSQWGLVGMPIFEENKGGLAFSDSLFSISKYSNNDEAVKFLEYVQGKEFAELLANASIFPSYWDGDMKKRLMKKHGYDFSPVYEQPGALIDNAEFKGPKYNEIKSAGADYFVKYMNGKGNINNILIEYENDVNK
ncbi:extracellular solute-binding protein [Viridibacillus sp. YIM B01967]|uniref:Extracellular solute-binding protein n=1 Tax=Viridibacillus soli TaxID=2798301 RepID=A0ABS1H4K8_9BACL|nr:extracellular solute-binding protein [Viridibacillus soli]MBK3494226.1 extracellular solute-binding protein [Viridibacillus soli]